MSADELDSLLDQGDEAPFDSMWIKLNLRVCEVSVTKDYKELFLRLSNATNHHEVCSCITGDLELINKAEIKDIDSEFLDYLKHSYEQGVVPCEWHS